MKRLLISLLFVSATLWMQPSHAATELEERNLIGSSVQKAFLQDDFSQLEATSQLYRKEKSRTPSGVWKLSVFYGAIYAAINTLTRGRNPDEAYVELESKMAKWTQAYPKSPSAHIVHSMALLTIGWAHRGGGLSKTVKPEAWVPFLKYVGMARKNLEAHKKVAAVDPRWYETMLIVARAESWDRIQFDSLLNEALKREPLFYETYFMALEYLLPKWHGGMQEIEDFANDAVRRTSKKEGRGMYARIYWYASQSQFENYIFTDSLAVWPRMKAGFEDVIKKYPDAWNLNNFTKFACLAEDKEKARELLKRTESDDVPQAWDPRWMRKRCTEWVLE